MHIPAVYSGRMTAGSRLPSIAAHPNKAPHPVEGQAKICQRLLKFASEVIQVITLRNQYYGCKTFYMWITYLKCEPLHQGIRKHPRSTGEITTTVSLSYRHMQARHFGCGRSLQAKVSIDPENTHGYLITDNVAINITKSTK